MVASIGMSAATEVTKRKIGLSQRNEGSLIATEGNFEALRYFYFFDFLLLSNLTIPHFFLILFSAGLSRLRGAALKLGQMLSIQDEEFIPAPLANLLSRLR